MAENAIFVLGGDAETLEQIVHAVEPLGHVHASCAWTEVAGPMLQALLRPERQVALICDVDALGARGLDFCRVVRKHAARVRIVVFAPTSWHVPDDLRADAVVGKAAGIAALARAAAITLGAGSQRR